MIRPPVVTVMGTSTTARPGCSTRSATPTSSRARPAASPSTSVPTRCARSQRGERTLTFIDTPGRDEFAAMQPVVAQVADIAVLVVAADDGVKPQTIEALNHAQAAGVPIVVAVNKIDKEGADPAKVRGQLTEYGLVAEEYGGDTMFVDVSARENIGLDNLLDAIVLTAEASLDLRANPHQPAQGVSIEAHLDRGRGPVATVRNAARSASQPGRKDRRPRHRLRYPLPRGGVRDGAPATA